MFYTKTSQTKLEKALKCKLKACSELASAYEFAQTDQETSPADTLMRVFNLKADEEKNFRHAYNQAVSGDGHEEENLLKPHSSALLPLLCFYRVSEQHPLTIDGREYNRCFFEAKNDVRIKDGHPSNVDVVLRSTDEKTLLFIESKFAEPLNGKAFDHLAEKYVDWLRWCLPVTGPDGKKLSRDEHEAYLKDKAGIDLEAAKISHIRTLPNGETKQQYCEGIKQMIAHLIGILTGPTDKQSDDVKAYAKAYAKAENYILCSIMLSPDNPLFDTDEQAELEHYSRYFSQAMNVLGAEHRTTGSLCAANTKSENSKLAASELAVFKPVALLPDMLTYEDVFGRQNPGFLHDKVEAVYRIAR